MLLNRAADPGLGDPRSDALSVSVASESVGGVELGGLGSFLRLRSRDRKRIVLQIDFICQRLLEDAAAEL